MDINLLGREIFGMQSGKEFYKIIIDFVLHTFNEIFAGKMVIIKKQIVIKHMGYFKIQYKYLPLQYDIVFENDRNMFQIQIIDKEGAKNLLYRIEKYNSELTTENIRNAIVILKNVLLKNNMCFYVSRDNKVYKKIGQKYKRIKDLNEIN